MLPMMLLVMDMLLVLLVLDMLLAVLMGIDLDLLLDMLLMLVLKLLMLLDQRLDQQNRKNSPRLHYGGSVLGLSSVLGSISNVPGGSISVVIGGRTRDTWKRSRP